MGFRSPLSAAQIAVIVGGAVPTAAAIDAQPNSAAAATQATTAATQATTAAGNSAVARIRSMTRIAFTIPAGTNSQDLPIAVTAARSQVALVGAHVVGSGLTATDLAVNMPSISAVTNTAVTVTRLSSSADAVGFVEVMEWI